ncbi:MAG: acyl-CoA dehydrogenase family protein [Chloroflexota bacterium]|nr:acyl-CoA dehydrogenase family protein [Chloroflexota bacterium]
MSFVFSESEELFRRQIQEFTQKELAPGAKDRAKDTKVDMSLVKKMADIGLLGMNVPEKYGGQQVSWVTVGIAIEEMAKADFTVSVLPIGSAGYLGQAMTFAPEYLQDRWFKPVVDGDILACLCLTEPDAGSDAVGIKTKAVRDGDDYVINGEKTSISWGMQAGIGVVFAKTDPSAGAKGVSAFLLPTDTPGIVKSSIPDMGWPTAQRASYFLDDVHLPADHRLGEEGMGFFLAMNVIGVVRICLVLQAIGHAEGALDEAIEYAKQRTAFGRPLANFQAVSFKIAEEATKLEAARLLCYRALGLRDAGERHLKEASMAKWFGARAAVEACHEALLIHGQIGYSEECPAEQRLRNVIGTEIGDGTAEIMKLNIAREMIGKEFQPL